MNKNIILCGVGGQGTVLASKLIAYCAMQSGNKVMSAETIGMAQKGGSVFSHLRIGNDVYSPMIEEGEADMIIAFEPAEAVRLLPYLKADGCVISCTDPVMPVTATLSGGKYDAKAMTDYLKAKIGSENLILIDCKKECEKLGSPRVMNMVLLGAAVRSGKLGISMDEMMSALKVKVKPQFFELNCKALEAVKIK